MELQTFLTSIMIGSASGVLAGILPGVGATVTVLLLFPYLITQDPISIVVCFTSLYSMSQFVGSVPAILLGIPGETSSLPAVIEGKKLKLLGKVNESIAYTALGSVVGSMICLFFVFVIRSYLDNLVYVYRTSIQISLIFLVLLVLIYRGGNKIFINLLLLAVGFTLGMIGMNGVSGTGFLHFGYANLQSGLPLFPVILSLFVLPQFYQTINDSKQNKKIQTFEIKLEYFVNFFKYISASVRGTILGFIGGFCPGLTHAFSSQLAYQSEQLIKHKEDRELKSLISAETANNAGAFSAILPLIILGIPISSSEALLLTIMQMRGWDLSISDYAPILTASVQALVLVNLLGLITAWPFAKHISKLLLIPEKILYPSLFLILILLNYYIGMKHWNELWYMAVLSIFLPIGWLFRRYNTMPLIFAFIIAKYFYSLLVVGGQLWLQ